MKSVTSSMRSYTDNMDTSSIEWFNQNKEWHWSAFEMRTKERIQNSLNKLFIVCSQSSENNHH